MKKGENNKKLLEDKKNFQRDIRFYIQSEYSQLASLNIAIPMNYVNRGIPNKISKNRNFHI